jgi:sec-independent protein translocase protein TatB
MFGIDSGELLIIAVVALVVIGPKDLPRVMRALGSFIGRARGMARHFRSGLDAMVREVELEDMEKKWQADNDRIMREHPAIGGDSDWGKPAPEATAGQRPPAAPAALPGGSAPPIPPAGVIPPPKSEPS